jgi:hypothetical protein
VNNWTRILYRITASVCLVALLSNHGFWPSLTAAFTLYFSLLAVAPDD